MGKYQLRKINPQSRDEYRYSTCDVFSTFSDLRDEINHRSDIWYGGGFDVLDAAGNILFDRSAALFCINAYGKKFTLAQLTENFNSGGNDEV